MNPVLKGSFDICAGALLLIVVAVAGPSFAQSVTTYHGSLERTGNFVVPALTWDRARRVDLDRSFEPHFSGHVYSLTVSPFCFHSGLEFGGNTGISAVR